MSINTHRLWNIAGVVIIAIASLIQLSPASAATLDRIRETGHIRFGYFADAAPFTSASGGSVEGYAASLCQRVADHVKGELGLASLTVEWVPVTHDAALDAVTSGSNSLRGGRWIALSLPDCSTQAKDRSSPKTNSIKAVSFSSNSVEACAKPMGGGALTLA